MATSIKERIYNNILTRLADIQVANQYETDIGTEVLREIRSPVSEGKLPCVGFHPDLIEKTINYGKLETRLLPVSIQGIMEFGTTSPPTLAEKMTADIEECILSDEMYLAYNSGGTSLVVAAGHDITGNNSGATARVVSITTTAGEWNTGNAVGVMTLRRMSGTFQANEMLTVGTDTDVATVSTPATGTGAIELSTDNLADKINFISSKATMPEADGTTVGATVLFHIEYKVKAGNPYSQIP